MATFYTGNTGASTGPHLDLQVFNPSTGSYEDPGKYTSFLTVGDNKDPFNFRITSPPWNARASDKRRNANA